MCGRVEGEEEEEREENDYDEKWERTLLPFPCCPYFPPRRAEENRVKGTEG